MIQFTDDCILGIQQLDDEHRHLFELMNDAMILLEDHRDGDNYDEIRTLIMELDEYVQIHFDHEEAYMLEIHDPELPSQRSQHTLFRNRIHNWYTKSLNTSEEQTAILTEIIQYMFKWLYNHIIGSDLMIGKFPPIEEWLLKENPCEFTEDYLIGIDLIDEEHRKLFRLIGQINSLVRIGVTEDDFDEIKTITKELNNYVKKHFSDEEQYMESINYKALKAQRAAHAVFIAKMDSINFDAIKKKPQENMEKLVEFLMQWLIQHIIVMDKKIGEV
ncbi:MAG: bacteriohemerythrin [Eubacterium sp.]